MRCASTDEGIRWAGGLLKIDAGDFQTAHAEPEERWRNSDAFGQAIRDLNIDHKRRPRSLQGLGDLQEDFALHYNDRGIIGRGIIGRGIIGRRIIRRGVVRGVSGF